MRMILSLVLLACLLAPGVRAQTTADQLNKLSLEALTAPPPRGSGGGYAPSARHRPAWLPRPSSSRAQWRRPAARYAATRPRWSASRAHAPRYQAARARYVARYHAAGSAHRPTSYRR